MSAVCGIGGCRLVVGSPEFDACGCQDGSHVYCQGCGAAPHSDGSRCGPKCPVQIYPLPAGRAPQ